MKKISKDTKTLLNMISNARYAAGNIAYEAAENGEKSKKAEWDNIFELLSILENKMYDACNIKWDEFHREHREIEEYEFD